MRAPWPLRALAIQARGKFHFRKEQGKKLRKALEERDRASGLKWPVAIGSRGEPVGLSESTRPSIAPLSYVNNSPGVRRSNVQRFIAAKTGRSQGIAPLWRKRRAA
jgi:hypothetical protein